MFDVKRKYTNKSIIVIEMSLYRIELPANGYLNCYTNITQSIIYMYYYYRSDNTLLFKGTYNYV